MYSMLWVYAGSFDPVTPGHINIALRAAQECNHLTILIANNMFKRERYPVKTRVLLLQKVFGGHTHIDVQVCHGCVAWWAIGHGAVRLVRGARSWRDWIVEIPMAAVNAMLGLGLRTRIYAASPSLKQVSSSTVREYPEVQF